MLSDLALAPRLPEAAAWIPKGLREPPTRWFRGRLDEVREALPAFDRRPFALAPENEGPWHANDLLDLVATRDDAGDGWAARPVGVVSKGYRLIGHREAARQLAAVLARLGFESDGLDTHATVDRFGATCALEVNLGPRWMMRPLDGHPLMLQLRCLNSVDGSTALRVAFNWLRLVCRNGLTTGFTQAASRVIHRGGDDESLEERIARGLARARADQASTARWFRLPIDPEALAPFADGPLREAWGVRDAARFLHIARTGRDAELADRFAAGKPSEKPMAPGCEVPGSPREATNAWDAAQALAWIAKDRSDPAAHLARMVLIPVLVGRLAKPRGDPAHDPRIASARRPLRLR